MHSAVQLVPLPAFTDNYIWMIHDRLEAWVVDPGDAAPVIAQLDALRLTLAGILVTHHHADHTGGLDALRARVRGPVYAPARERMPIPVVPLFDGDRIRVLGSEFEVIAVPGHTAGHIAYVERIPGARESDSPLLFCGDTLFSGGCGRLFEGTPQQMSRSLGRLAALSPNTKVCCTHEYTLANLKFATAVEPGNEDLATYRADCEARRAAGRPTLPSTIGVERRINPFLRCDQPEVVAAARTRGATSDDPVDVFAAVREWKNTFK